MKYILKKEYPGSPKLGNIIDNLENDWIENYPEFWEEVVVEKDYEILSLARLCTIKPTITDVSDYGDGYIEALLKCDNSRIHSVKRLSDGKEEIFTISDKTNNGTISKFEIDSNGIRVFFEEKPKNYHVSLNSIKHIKKPLFTTEQRSEIEEIIKNIIK